MLTEIFFILLSYVWGSIPTGYIILRQSTGINILEHGSGNVGSTNVGRIAGKKLSLITQLLDMIKGLVPVGLCLILAEDPPTTYYIYMLALAVILGHDFSIFLKFRGGKGVNTTLGASILLAPYAVIISGFLYLIVKWRFRYVSIGSLSVAIAMPLIEFLIYGLSSTFYYLIITSSMIILLHRKNIHRLIKGNELTS